MKIKGWSTVIIGICSLVVMTILPLATACTKPTTQPASRVGWPDTISIASKPVGGGSYVAAVGLQQLWQKYVGLTVAVEPCPGSGAQAALLRDGKAEVAFHIDPVELRKCILQEGPYEGKGELDGRQIMSSPPMIFQILTPEWTNIKTPYDLAGKNLLFQPASLVQKTFVEALVKAYGIEGKVKLGNFRASAEAVAAMKERRADASLFPLVPHAAVAEELITTVGVYFVPITGKEADAIVAECEPFFVKSAMPKDSFTDQKKDIPGLGVIGCTAARADLPDSLMYEMVKVMDEHFDEWVQVEPKIVPLYHPKYFARRMFVPIHAGAIQYYKEKGWWKSEHEKRQKELLQLLGKQK